MRRYEGMIWFRFTHQLFEFTNWGVLYPNKQQHDIPSVYLATGRWAFYFKPE